MKMYSLIPTVLLITHNNTWNLTLIWLGVHLTIYGHSERRVR